MGGKRFTETDDKYIMKNYGKMHPRTIAIELNRTARSVTNRYKRLITNGTKLSDYSDEQKEYPSFNLVKTRHGSVYTTTRREMVNILNKSLGDPKIVMTKFESIIELIKDDYIHSDLCMTKLIKSKWMDKVDLEDIGVLLHWAGEEYMISDFACNE